MKIRELTKDQKEQIIKEYLEGKGTGEISREYGLKQGGIVQFLRQNKILLRPLSLAKRKYSIDMAFFEKIDTPEKAQVLGILYADEWNGVSLSTIYLNLAEEDKEYLEKIRNILKYERELVFRPIDPKTKMKQPQYVIQIYCKKMCEDLDKLGCIQGKTQRLRFPNEERVPKELLKHFIRGYFEGDGHVCKAPNYRCGFSGNLPFLQELQKYTKETLNVHLSLIKDHSIYALSTGGGIQFFKFMDWLYSDAPFVMERKYQKYIENKEYRKKELEHRNGNSFTALKLSTYLRSHLKLLAPIPRLIQTPY